MAASSSSTQQDAPLSPLPESSQPLQLPAPPQPSSTSSRRLPPPCWSHDETVALIDSYRDKWYSLRRSNLKATHWQDVADAVGERCPIASPAKTAVQCRHKMEKLRKRYRTEIQRAKSMPVSRFTSSWVHFKRMDSMEKGPQAANPVADSGSDGNEEEEEEDEDVDVDDYDPIMYQNGVKNGRSSRSVYGSTSNGVGGSGGGGGGSGSGFRIRLSNGVSIAKPGKDFRAKNYSKFDQNSPPNPNLGTRVLSDSTWTRPRLGKRRGGGDGDVGGKRDNEGSAVAEMVSAIKVLGDGFVKMEQVKMEMAREIETMRMEMEMKRTEMILESQERIVEAFAKAVSEKKKPKRMP